MSTSEGSTSERPGLSNTSSKVNASGRAESIFGAIANPFRPRAGSSEPAECE
jgi:hypothetical protein